MTSKRYVQGDIVHIEAIVEADGGDNANLIIKGIGGAEQRLRVPKTIVRHHERGPIRPGDTVFKKVKSGRMEGTVEHRAGAMAWVRWGEDAHSIEPVEALSR